MFEKVNPSHPNKVADRIAGAVVDLAYKKSKAPKVAVEVLLGHGVCLIINETDTHIKKVEIIEIVERIVGYGVRVKYKEVKQDKHLAHNQKDSVKCGDNGIFKGTKTTKEQQELTNIAKNFYNTYNSDGKYLLDGDKLVVCQSHCDDEYLHSKYKVIINPLGYWTGGANVDSGATNRKLGSDMGDAVTGGGLHGKDLSKADVTLNIVCHLLAKTKPITCSCAIGDSVITFSDGTSMKYEDCVELASNYIKEIGGFEEFAKWGLIRPTK